jgi:hypothetical protein
MMAFHPIVNFESPTSGNIIDCHECSLPRPPKTNSVFAVLFSLQANCAFFSFIQFFMCSRLPQFSCPETPGLRDAAVLDQAAWMAAKYIPGTTGLKSRIQAKLGQRSGSSKETKM